MKNADHKIASYINRNVRGQHTMSQLEPSWKWSPQEVKGLRAGIITAHLSTMVKVLIRSAYFKICIKQNILKNQSIITEIKERKEILIFRDL